MVFVAVAYGQGWIQGCKMRGMRILPPAILENVLMYTILFIISSLFDSKKPYAISTHNRKCVKKKLNRIWLKIIEKALK